MTERAAEELARLGPFGAGHPEPVFALRGAAGRARTVGAGEGAPQARARARPRRDRLRHGRPARRLRGPGRGGFTLGFDEWDGARRLQLKLRDVRPSHGAARPQR